jgi:hypothetical protein
VKLRRTSAIWFTDKGDHMRVVFGTICLLVAASPAMALIPGNPCVAAVPAPLLGVGLPAMAVIGGVLLVARLFKRN